jgi:hypothetical protein
MGLKEDFPQLKVGTGWTLLEVIGESDVVTPARGGYVPVIKVRTPRNGNLEYILYITAVSLTRDLEPLRVANNGRFDGLRFEIRKTAGEKSAPYELRSAGD